MLGFLEYGMVVCATSENKNEAIEKGKIVFSFTIRSNSHIYGAYEQLAFDMKK